MVFPTARQPKGHRQQRRPQKSPADGTTLSDASLDCSRLERKREASRDDSSALVWILTETAIVAAIVLPMQNLATGVAAVSCATKHVWSPLFLVRVTSDVWMLIRDKHELIIKLIP